MNLYFSYRNDENIAKYQSWTDKTESQIHFLIKEQAKLKPGIPNKWFMFAIELKITNKMIGDCAFCINKDDPSQAELGITLSYAYQGEVRFL